VFQHDEACAVRAQKRLIAGFRFAVALSLHEDYDARGVYLYEIEGAKPFWGEALLEKASRILPPDPRPTIEGRRARGGLIRRKIDPRFFRKMGFPEAVYLHLHHAANSLTFETPSEFAIERRVRAQVAVIDEVVRRAAQVRIFSKRKRAS
jgi:murein peptide amidase A